MKTPSLRVPIQVEAEVRVRTPRRDAPTWRRCVGRQVLFTLVYLGFLIGGLTPWETVGAIALGTWANLPTLELFRQRGWL